VAAPSATLPRSGAIPADAAATSDEREDLVPRHVAIIMDGNPPLGA